MLFILKFQLLLRVVFLLRWGVYGFLRITLWCCLFLSESNIFENSIMKIFHSDLISIGRIESRF